MDKFYIASKPATSPKGMYINNIAYIPPKWNDIRIAYMKELGEISPLWWFVLRVA